jgi:hypothetical protein
MALLIVPVLGQDVMSGSATGGNDGVDMLGAGIFESNGNAFQISLGDADVNFDSITVGNDKATSFGQNWGWPHSYGPANAVNNVEIKKNQDSGACASCCGGEATTGCEQCADACLKTNIEQIKLGNRDAMAFGFSNAANNMKIVTNQI